MAVDVKRAAKPGGLRFYFFSWLIFFGVCLLQSPGRISADTKLDLAINPEGFLARAWNLWSATAPMGQVQNQAYGYFFPQGLFYYLTHCVHITPWIAQRLWWSLVLIAGFSGFIVLVQIMKIAQGWAALVGAVAYTFSPRVLTTLGAISSETLPYMLAPWIAIPVLQALQPHHKPLWKLALLSSFAFFLTGAVNAVASVAALAFAVLIVLSVKIDRHYKVFTLWWGLFLGLLSLWWLVPLVLLSKISPPFLDYIESSRVTTKWASLVEVLRGTGTWYPYVNDVRPAGSFLVSNWVEVLVTMAIVAISLVGLTNRKLPYRGVLLFSLLIGLLIYVLGYNNSSFFHGLGSPVATQVRIFLDQSGKALRNIHKWEPLVRLPLLLSFTFVCGQAFRTVSSWRELCGIHPRPAYGLVLLAPLLVVLSMIPVGVGGLAAARSFTGIPSYWNQASTWLRQHDTGRVLVVPGAPSALQTWGYTSDFPLQPLATTPWAIRDAIPLIPSEGIRYLDAVEGQLESGFDSPGLAQTLRQGGFSHVLVAGDYDTVPARTISPFVALQTLSVSPGIHRAASFGQVDLPPMAKDVVALDGLRVAPPAITIFSVDPADMPAAQASPGAQAPPTQAPASQAAQAPASPGAQAPASQAPPAQPHNALQPYVVDASAVQEVYGGAEAQALVNSVAPNRQQWDFVQHGPQQSWLFGQRPAIVTDTPLHRETDYGRVFDNHSALMAPSDPPRVPNEVADYATREPLVQGRWDAATVSVSSSASDATELGQVHSDNSPAALFDHDPKTMWVSRNLSHAVGQWVRISFAQPTEVLLSLTTGKALGSQVNEVRVDTDKGTLYTRGIRPGVPQVVFVPAGKTSTLTITAAATSDNSLGNQFVLSDVSLKNAATGVAIPVQFRTVLPSLDSGAYVRDWVFGQSVIGRVECVRTHQQRVGTLCSRGLGLSVSEPNIFERTISVPQQVHLSPYVWVRSRSSAALNGLLNPQNMRIIAGSSTIDPSGNTLALDDASPATSWTSPAVSNDDSGDRSHPSDLAIDMIFPKPQLVNRIHFSAPEGQTPARVLQVAINTGSGRYVRTIGPDGWVSLPAKLTKHVHIVILAWENKLLVNDLGFSERLRPGFSGITIGLADGKLLNPPAAHDVINVGCDQGPVVAFNNTVFHYHFTATREQLIDHDVIRAQLCTRQETTVNAGSQDVYIDPGEAFTVAYARLHNVVEPMFFSSPNREYLSTKVWGATRREIPINAGSQTRVLVIPESYNVGWKGYLAGQELKTTPINGWEMGVLIPPGLHGMITLVFPSSVPYQYSFYIGFAIAALLLIGLQRNVPLPLKLLPRSFVLYSGRRVKPAEHRTVSSWVITVGAFMWAGLACGGAGIALTAIIYCAHRWYQRWSSTRTTKPYAIVSALSAMLAGVWLSRGPWRDFTDYHGFSPLPQALCLIAIVTVIFSFNSRQPSGLE